jgi:tetratricopeptide (TPR) repeat protein
MSSIASGAIRVFVSSTWLDLKPERQAVETLLQRMRETKFAGMEYFGSRDENTQRASLDEVDRSQVYVGVFAGRYGSGITEDEYRRARDLKLPCFIYFKRESEIPAEWSEIDAAKIAKLAALKEELRRNHTVAEFNSTDNLAAKVTADLHRWLFDQYLQPQLERAAEGARPRDQAQALLDAIKDTDALDAKLLSRARQVIVSGERNVAFGGDASNSVIFTGDRFVINVPTASVFNPLHQLPSLPRDFTGRAEELGELLAALDRGTIISGVQGLGGVGKTALALKLADEIKDRYPDAQFYLDLRGVSDNPLTPAEAMTRIIRAYLLTDHLPQCEAELQPIYLSVLHNQRALLLMDNARDDAQVRPLIPPTSCLLLVTSRRHFTLPEMTARRLGALSPEDAVALLHKVAPRIRDWNGSDAEIAAACGHLPLALRAAGSLLEVTLDLHPADYARQLRDERTRLEIIGAEGVDHGVEASFNLSYERLIPEAARVFRQLTIFAGSFDAAAEETICVDARHKRLSELVRLSLVEYDNAEQRYRLHELMRVFAKFKLNTDEKDAVEKRFIAHYQEILFKSNQMFLKGGESLLNGLNLFEIEQRNIQKGQSIAADKLSTDEFYAMACFNYVVVSGNLLLQKLPLREATKWFEASLSSAFQLQNLAAMLNPLFLLGHAAKKLGEYQQSIEHFEQAKRIAESVGDSVSAAISTSNIAEGYSELGDFDKAIDLLKRAKQQLCDLGEHSKEGKVIMNLALTLSKAGRRNEAIGLLDGVISHARENGDRLEEANALGNLSSVLAKGELLPSAIQRAEEATGIFAELGYPQWHAQSLAALADFYASSNNISKSILHLERALTIYREINDIDGEMRTLGIMGQAWARDGNHLKAIEMFEQQLSLAQREGSKNQEINALDSKGQSLALIGRKEEAIAYMRAAAAAARSVLNYEDEFHVYCHIAELHEKDGDYYQAIETYKEQLTVAQQIAYVGRTIHSLDHLANAYEKVGDEDRATQFREDQLRVSQNSSDLHDKAGVLRDYAKMLVRFGKMKEGVGKALEAVTLFRQIEDHSCALRLEKELSDWSKKS